MTALALPGDFLAVAMAVTLLGVRHGFDPDHLAAIEGMTYQNASRRPALARACGALFSIGHGAVVIAVAVAASVLARAWQPPLWLAAVGSWTSIVVLTALGALNVAAVFRTPRGEVTRLKGWRSGAFAGLLRAGHPLSVMAVGTLFAISFDTFGQAVLFAMTATQFAGWRSALALGLLFTFGMLLCDGINGYCVSKLILRSNRNARIASRTMALAVAGVSLGTAALALATLLTPGSVAWAEGKELWLGSAILALAGLGFVVGQRLA
jgi:nickel/cobalt transporter (NiCoT) family protein